MGKGKNKQKKQPVKKQDKPTKPTTTEVQSTSDLEFSEDENFSLTRKEWNKQAEEIINIMPTDFDVYESYMNKIEVLLKRYESIEKYSKMELGELEKNNKSSEINTIPIQEDYSKALSNYQRLEEKKNHIKQEMDEIDIKMKEVGNSYKKINEDIEKKLSEEKEGIKKEIPKIEKEIMEGKNLKETDRQLASELETKTKTLVTYEVEKERMQNELINEDVQEFSALHTVRSISNDTSTLSTPLIYRPTLHDSVFTQDSEEDDKDQIKNHQNEEETIESDPEFDTSNETIGAQNQPETIPTSYEQDINQKEAQTYQEIKVEENWIKSEIKESLLDSNEYDELTKDNDKGKGSSLLRPESEENMHDVLEDITSVIANVSELGEGEETTKNNQSLTDNGNISDEPIPSKVKELHDSTDTMNNLDNSSNSQLDESLSNTHIEKEYSIEASHIDIQPSVDNDNDNDNDNSISPGHSGLDIEIQDDIINTQTESNLEEVDNQTFNSLKENIEIHATEDPTSEGKYSEVKVQLNSNELSKLDASKTTKQIEDEVLPTETNLGEKETIETTIIDNMTCKQENIVVNISNSNKTDEIEENDQKKDVGKIIQPENKGIKVNSFINFESSQFSNSNKDDKDIEEATNSSQKVKDGSSSQSFQLFELKSSDENANKDEQSNLIEKEYTNTAKEEEDIFQSIFSYKKDENEALNKFTQLFSSATTAGSKTDNSITNHRLFGNPKDESGSTYAINKNSTSNPFSSLQKTPISKGNEKSEHSYDSNPFAAPKNDFKSKEGLNFIGSYSRNSSGLKQKSGRSKHSTNFEDTSYNSGRGVNSLSSMFNNYDASDTTKWFQNATPLFQANPIKVENKDNNISFDAMDMNQNLFKTDKENEPTRDHPKEPTYIDQTNGEIEPNRSLKDAISTLKGVVHEALVRSIRLDSMVDETIFDYESILSEEYSNLDQRGKANIRSSLNKKEILSHITNKILNEVEDIDKVISAALEKQTSEPESGFEPELEESGSCVDWDKLLDELTKEQLKDAAPVQTSSNDEAAVDESKLNREMILNALNEVSNIDTIMTSFMTNSNITSDNLINDKYPTTVDEYLDDSINFNTYISEITKRDKAISYAINKATFDYHFNKKVKGYKDRLSTINDRASSNMFGFCENFDDILIHLNMITATSSKPKDKIECNLYEEDTIKDSLGELNIQNFLSEMNFIPKSTTEIIFLDEDESSEDEYEYDTVGIEEDPEAHNEIDPNHDQKHDLNALSYPIEYESEPSDEEFEPSALIETETDDNKIDEKTSSVSYNINEALNTEHKSMESKRKQEAYVEVSDLRSSEHNEKQSISVDLKGVPTENNGLRSGNTKLQSMDTLSNIAGNGSASSLNSLGLNIDQSSAVDSVKPESNSAQEDTLESNSNRDLNFPDDSKSVEDVELTKTKNTSETKEQNTVNWSRWLNVTPLTTEGDIFNIAFITVVASFFICMLVPIILTGLYYIIYINGISNQGVLRSEFTIYDELKEAFYYYGHNIIQWLLNSTIIKPGFNLFKYFLSEEFLMALENTHWYSA